ncbi:ankyrin repeat-containing domain protein [Xylaria telfairii]|nr:ankyrin repeat-containing domain protein [Xylaria telfairii]
MMEVPYHAAALVAGTHKALRTGDRSIVEYLLTRREPREPVDMHVKFLESIALATAVSFGDVTTWQILLDHGLTGKGLPHLPSAVPIRLPQPYLEWYSISPDGRVYAHCKERRNFHYSVSPSGQYQSTEIYENRRQILGDFSLLGVAVHGEQEDLVKVLLRQGYKPILEDVICAVILDDLEMAELLLGFVEDVDNKLRSPHALLQTAILMKLEAFTKALLDRGVDVNTPAPDNLATREGPVPGRTALQAACETGNLILVKLLIDAGANVNAPPTSSRGATALQLAVIKGHFQIARYLIELGANIDAPAAQEYGRTALEAAAEHGRIDILA